LRLSDYLNSNNLDEFLLLFFEMIYYAYDDDRYFSMITKGLIRLSKLAFPVVGILPSGVHQEKKGQECKNPVSTDLKNTNPGPPVYQFKKRAAPEKKYVYDNTFAPLPYVNPVNVMWSSVEGTMSWMKRKVDRNQRKLGFFDLEWLFLLADHNKEGVVDYESFCGVLAEYGFSSNPVSFWLVFEHLSEN
jgi:hypothetical protein